ncbi:MAG TPA: prolyl oligopeptidase family serine peptidase [Candidatus Sulfopaludibacter sp.]|jgi:dipeptidyl aminopeptidase/acylaminoacyl peptidase|nr:prolyl oligopeptidase family serine peptidase [Candidatus Sulfopaludibacter sp.]
MLHRFLSATLLISCALAQPAKRPLNHHDYDGWRTIASQHLSADGKFLAYAVFPQEGDGEVIVRNLTTGQETRYPAGARPAPAAAAVPEEGPPPEARGATITFSSDSHTVVFSTFPSKADTDKAKKEKKTADQMPKDGMVIVNLASGQTARVERVKRFALAEKASAFVAYLKDAPEGAAGRAAAAKPDGDSADQQAGRGGRGGGAAGGGRGARPEFGTDLVVRSLTDGSEHTYSDVAEFTFTEDGKQIVYAVSARDAARNGVFLVKPGSAEAAAALLSGKGKYLKLTWDEKQTELAFLSSKDDPDAKQPKWKLYRWDRQSPAAAELASSDAAGLRKGLVITDKGAMSFSRDGSHIFFATAPPPEPEKKAEDTDSTEEKAVVDLWSYKDDYIQPIQKVHAARDRDRTFTAIYSIPDRRVVQLADTELETVTASENAQWILGSDDRAYRKAADYDPGYTDHYVVDSTTGTRKLVSSKSRGAVTWSPNGKYLLSFDGKDWNTISVPEGKAVNLTATLPVKFWNEDTDTPSTPGSYGNAGWTKDGKAVLLYDHYDIWSIAPDGSGAKNLTAGYGRQHGLEMRYVRTEAEARERWIDPTKPLLVHAQGAKTWQTGFFRASLAGGEPKQLVMSSKNLSVPVKAKDADVYLLTEQTFNEFPDMVTTDGTFKELRKVSNVNPQKAQLSWGTSDLVKFKNSDGVALEAALYKPENFDAHKKYPMMVYIYEKLSQNGNRFVNPAPGTNINISYYVSNGYLVLTPDIVYTTGYPGQSALKCVLPAIQAVVDQGIVNEDAIGIQGHSWGGYQIAYMVTQTKRFKAVAAGAPVVDMIAAYDGIRWGTGLPRQFQYEHTQSRIGGSIWEYPTRFIENSPIFWADRVQTPVMILQNDGDDAVPWYQGIEFFLALRRLGKEVWMFNYNGQPHGLRNRADQKDYTIRLQQYFDHFLKGAPAPDWMEKGVPYLQREKTALSELGGQQ